MSSRTSAAELARAFDARFAAAPPEAVGPVERLLVVGVGEARAAIRLRDLAGLFAVPRIARVPDGAPGLLGIAGVRGRVVPVFDLAALADRAMSTRGPAYLAIAAGLAPVGLLFRGAIEYVEVPGVEVDDARHLLRGAVHLAGAARVGGTLVRLLDVPGITAEIAARTEASP